ncbi:MAG TPA: methyltransferase [Pirellulales bacterium]|nr:methyltransferase [Pirellulales bacterium]
MAAVTLSARTLPSVDPTPIFELFRGSLATELLSAAVGHFDLFGRLAGRPVPFDALAAELGLAERAAVVLLVSMRAMGLVETDAGPGGHLKEGRLRLTPLAEEHLVPGDAFYVGDYVSLVADKPGVVEMVERLRTNKPAGAEPASTAQATTSSDAGVAFIYREGLESAMEQEATARRFTLALAGRAKNVAPHLAASGTLDGARLMVDVGGGTGIYSIACLQHDPKLRAIVWDRPEVLKVAAEMAAEYGVADRLECQPGDMFTDPVPRGADAILVSNVLHDWDVPANREIVGRLAAALASGGRLLVHDAFLNDALDGPLPIANYSAALFSLTEGRAYSAGEYRSWLSDAGLKPLAAVPTLVHCGVLPAVRP